MATEEKKSGGIGGFFKNLSPYLATVAQLAIPGPAGNLAASILNKVTGQDVKPTSISETIQNLSLTEDGRLKLDQAEKEFSLACKKMGYDDAEKILELDVEDRKDARQRQIALKDQMPAILTIFVTLGFFSTLWLVLIHGVNAQNAQVGDIMLGSLGTAWISCVAYYVGTTHDSSRKTDLLAKAQPIKED